MSSPAVTNDDTVAYEPGVFLLAGFDAEWSRDPEPNRNAFEKAIKDVDDAVTDYKKVMEGFAKKARDTQTGSIPAQFFRTLHFLAYGSEDILSAVWLDDLDTTHTILEKYPRNTHEVTLAFAPALNSFHKGKAVPKVQGTDHHFALLLVCRHAVRGSANGSNQAGHHVSGRWVWLRVRQGRRLPLLAGR